MKIISGGQTGVDRAALDAAIACGISHGGWLPKGRLTEDGPLPSRYRLRELSSPRYRDRTEKNVLSADATLIVSYGPLTGGSALTEALALRHDRPCLHVNLACETVDAAVDRVCDWLRDHQVKTLNVAGPRASSEPRMYKAVYRLLLQVFGRLDNVQ